MKNLSDRLRWLFSETGLKPSKAARFCGVSPGYISNLLKGLRSNPSDDVVAKLAEFFGCSDAWLDRGVGEPDLLGPSPSMDAARSYAATFGDDMTDKEVMLMEDIGLRVVQLKHVDPNKRAIYTAHILERIRAHCEDLAQSDPERKDARLRLARAQHDQGNDSDSDKP